MAHSGVSAVADLVEGNKFMVLSVNSPCCLWVSVNLSCEWRPGESLNIKASICRKNLQKTNTFFWKWQVDQWIVVNDTHWNPMHTNSKWWVNYSLNVLLTPGLHRANSYRFTAVSTFSEILPRSRRSHSKSGNAGNLSGFADSTPQYSKTVQEHNIISYFNNVTTRPL